MKKILTLTTLLLLVITGCKKEQGSNTSTVVGFEALETKVINNFVLTIALPGYLNLQTKAGTLNDALVTLNQNRTEVNLTAAKLSWKDIRSNWEQCEGYLFGPVEDNEYDPEIDTWPVDYIQMDSLLKSSNTLTYSAINDLQVRSLKGFHPIEYILFGKAGAQTAANLSDRQLLYAVSLTAHLKKVTTDLYTSWQPSSGNFAAQITSAGMAGNNLFPTKLMLFVTLCNGMADICDEVATGKMYDPFIARNPDIVESPFSSNSTLDFKNNIAGAYQVYLGGPTANGNGITDLVSAKNISLDNEIRQKFIIALASFDAITVPYEQAIISQRVQCQNVMQTINDLQETIETKLEPFINQHIKD